MKEQIRKAMPIINRSTANYEGLGESQFKPVLYKNGNKLEKNEMEFNFRIAYREQDYLRVAITEILRSKSILINIKEISQELLKVASIETRPQVEQQLKSVDMALCIINQIMGEVEINTIDPNAIT